MNTTINWLQIEAIDQIFNDNGNSQHSFPNFTDTWSESIGVVAACGEMSYDVTDSDTGAISTIASIAPDDLDPS